MPENYYPATRRDKQGRALAFSTTSDRVFNPTTGASVKAEIGEVSSLSTTAKTVVPAINENKASIDTLSQNLVWKLAGTVSGTAPISIPKGASELFIMATASHGNKLSLSIPIISLTADTQYFALTAFQHTDSSVGSGIITATSANVSVYSMRFSNADITNSAILNLYYR